MADQSKAETITLKLEQQIDSAADAATGALGRLERQIGREENALGRLEKGLLDARSKLELLAQGAPNQKAVAAFEKQSAAVGELQVKLEAARAKMASLTAAGGEPKDLKAASKIVDTLTTKLVDANAKMEKLRAPAKSAVVDVAAYKKQEAAVSQLTDKVGAQRDKIGGLRDKLTESRTATKQLADATAFLGDKAGLTGSQAAQLGTQLAALGPYGAIAAAAILAVVGAVAVFVSVIAKGIDSAGKMRAELLTLQAASVSSAGGMNWLFNASRESTAQAERMQASINRVNAASSLGRAKLADYGAQIIALRFRGKEAETVLRAMSTAGAKSDGAAQSVLQMATAYRYAGKSVDALAQRIQDKLGRGAAAQAIALDVQMRRLGENITWIFGGADIDPLLRALDSVLRLFGAGSTSANTMRDAVTYLVEHAIGGMLRLGIAVLRAYIALRSNETAWNAIKLAVKAVVFGFAVMAGITTLVVGGIVVLAGALMALQAAIAGAAVMMVSKLGAAALRFASLAFSIGRFIVEGIANGLTAAGSKVWEALKAIVGGAIDKTKNLLGIASPSKVFFGLGHFTAQGMAGGINRGEQAVVGASAHMSAAMVASSRGMVANDRGVSAPAMAIRVQSPQQPAAQSGTSITFENCSFGGDVTEAKVRGWVRGAIEGEMLASGVAA